MYTFAHLALETQPDNVSETQTACWGFGLVAAQFSLLPPEGPSRSVSPGQKDKSEAYHGHTRGGRASGSLSGRSLGQP
jgi:hypothetical protein